MTEEYYRIEKEYQDWKRERSNALFIAAVISIVCFCGCRLYMIPGEEKRDRVRRAQSVEGFNRYVNNLYPGCKVLQLSVISPGLFSVGSCTATGIIELADGTRKPIELLCDYGACRQYVKK